MSGNPDKASIWGDADVYVGPTTAIIPATKDDPFPGTWSLVGLLDGEAGFEESRSRDSTDYFAWGGLLIRTSRRNFVLTRKFIALEDNAVVAGMIWPGSGPGVLAVPTPNARFKIGFQVKDGLKTKRAITRNYAEIEEIGTIKDSESELTKYEITVKIYPDANGVLFDLQPASGLPTLVSIALPTTGAVVAATANTFLKLAAVATYSDASTSDVTTSAAWVSATPAKATVDRGYVDGLAAGTSVVTAVYGGITSNGCLVTVS